MLETITRAVSGVALKAIRFYQRYISPLLPPSCRFQPTCSQYTYLAITRFGIWRGGWLGVRRLCRCNPFFPCGCDMVPEYWGQKVPLVRAKPVRRNSESDGSAVAETIDAVPDTSVTNNSVTEIPANVMHTSGTETTQAVAEVKS